MRLPRALPVRGDPAPGLHELEGDQLVTTPTGEGPPLRRGPSHHPETRPMTNKLLIAIAALIAAGFAALFGGVLHEPTAAAAGRACRLPVGRGLQGRLRPQREHRDARPEPPVDARREREGRAQLGAARARLPAARPRDRRPELLHEVGRRARAGALARPQGLSRLQRPRLARALAPSLRPRAPARRGGACALADDGAQLRRDRRRRDRARPLPARRSRTSTR